MGLIVYAYGVLVAVRLGASIDLTRAVLGYLAMMPAHLSVSYSNEAFDIEADRFGSTGPLSGGTGVLQRRPELQPVAVTMSLVLLAASIAIGALFVLRYQPGALFIGLLMAGGFLSWAYSSPPLRLSYRGWGEPATATTVGVIVPLFGYAATGHRLAPELIAVAPMSIAYAFLFVFCYQLPDRGADKSAGKPNWTSDRRVTWSAGAMTALCAAATAWLTAGVLLARTGLIATGGLPLGGYAALSSLPLATTAAFMLAATRTQASEDDALARSWPPAVLASVVVVMVTLTIILAP